MTLLLRQARSQQPQGAVQVDWRNPITRGLLSALCNGYECVSGTALLTPNVVNQFGRGYYYFTGQVGVEWVRFPVRRGLANSSEGSLFLLGGIDKGYTDFSVQVGASVFKDLYGISSYWMQGNGTIIPYVATSVDTTTPGYDFASAPPSSWWRSIVYDGQNMSSYAPNSLSGGERTYSQARTGTIVCSDETVGIVPSTFYGANYPGMALLLVFNRALSALDRASLALNPWQIFAPIRSNWAFPPLTVSIYRPSTDVLTTGWVPSTGSALWDMLDEVIPSDADYITSPSIDGSQGAAICGLNGSMVAGSYMVKIRSNATTEGKQVRVSLLDGSNVSQGDTGWVNVTASYAEYDTPVTTTGTATRVKMEVQ